MLLRRLQMLLLLLLLLLLSRMMWSIRARGLLMVSTVLLRYLMQLHIGVTIRIRDSHLRQLIVGHGAAPRVASLFRRHLIVTVHGGRSRSCRRLSVIPCTTGGLSSHRYRRDRR
uniref:Putative secreted protein n=1 Tax=Anopheles triannulatus TaxID=58253 RepID=A0A2M4B3G2_9DIPT